MKNIKKIAVLITSLIALIACSNKETILVDNDNPVIIEYEDLSIEILEVKQTYELFPYASNKVITTKAPQDKMFIDVIAFVSTDVLKDDKVWIQDIQYEFGDSTIETYKIFVEDNKNTVFSDRNTAIPNNKKLVHFIGLKNDDELLTEIPFSLNENYLIKADYNNYRMDIIERNEVYTTADVEFKVVNHEYQDSSLTVLEIDIKNNTTDDIDFVDSLIIKDPHTLSDKNPVYAVYEQKGDHTQYTHNITSDSDKKYYIYLRTDSLELDGISFMFLDSFYRYNF